MTFARLFPQKAQPYPLYGLLILSFQFFQTCGQVSRFKVAISQTNLFGHKQEGKTKQNKYRLLKTH